MTGALSSPVQRRENLTRITFVLFQWKSFAPFSSVLDWKFDRRTKDVRKKDGNLETFTKCKEKSGDNLSTLPLMFLFTRKVREHPAQRDARERNVHEQRRRTSDFLSRCTPRRVEVLEERNRFV